MSETGPGVEVLTPVTPPPKVEKPPVVEPQTGDSTPPAPNGDTTSPEPAEDVSSIVGAPNVPRDNDPSVRAEESAGGTTQQPTEGEGSTTQNEIDTTPAQSEVKGGSEAPRKEITRETQAEAVTTLGETAINAATLAIHKEIKDMTVEQQKEFFLGLSRIINDPTLVDFTVPPVAMRVQLEGSNVQADRVVERVVSTDGNSLRCQVREGSGGYAIATVSRDELIVAQLKTEGVRHISALPESQQKVVALYIDTLRSGPSALDKFDSQKLEEVVESAAKELHISADSMRNFVEKYAEETGKIIQEGQSDEEKALAQKQREEVDRLKNEALSHFDGKLIADRESFAGLLKVLEKGPIELIDQQVQIAEAVTKSIKERLARDTGLSKEERSSLKSDLRESQEKEKVLKEVHKSVEENGGVKESVDTFFGNIEKGQMSGEELTNFNTALGTGNVDAMVDLMFKSEMKQMQASEAHTLRQAELRKKVLKGLGMAGALSALFILINIYNSSKTSGPQQ